MSLESLSRSFEAHHAQVTRLADHFSGLQEQLDRVEATLKRPREDWGVDASRDANAKAKRAFEAYCRLGIERMPHELQNALTTDVDPSAGFLAPAEYEKALERNLVEHSPIRSIARVSTTNSGEVLLPKRTTNLNGYWVGETEARTETAPAYGMTSVPLGEIASFVDVSVRQLEDGAFQIGEELTQDFAEAFGAVEGAAFISADGTNRRPQGILQAPGVTTVVSGASTSVTADALLSMAYALPQKYRARATWILNRQSLSVIAKLKSGDGVWLFSPSLTAGQPSRLLGLPVVECPDMPDLSAGSKSIVLGDFSKYRIFDKPNGVQILRDPYSQATSGIVRFHGRRRVGATMQLPEAFRIMQTGA